MLKLGRCPVLIVLAVIAIASPAAARDLFVNNLGGDDKADGREPNSSTEGGPVRTIAQALELAQVGDHIHLANTGEPYRESITLSGADRSGFTLNPLTIIGNGATLDGSRPVPPREWEHVRDQLFRFRPPRGSHPLLFVAGRPAPRQAVDPAQGRLPQLTPGQWCAHDGHIYFAAEAGKAPRDYPLSYAALSVGITLYQVKNVAVLDLVVQGFHTDGVSAPDGARNVRLGGLILRGNGRAGLAVAGSSQVSADGCLVGDNGTAQIWLSGYGTLGLQNCELLAGSAPPVVRRGGRLFIDGLMQE